MSKSKNNKHKGFASADAPLFSEEDFLTYFEDRCSEMIRNEVETHFKDMLWKY